MIESDSELLLRPFRCLVTMPAIATAPKGVRAVLDNYDLHIVEGSTNVELYFQKQNTDKYYDMHLDYVDSHQLQLTSDKFDCLICVESQNPQPLQLILDMFINIFACQGIVGFDYADLVAVLKNAKTATLFDLQSPDDVVSHLSISDSILLPTLHRSDLTGYYLLLGSHDLSLVQWSESALAIESHIQSSDVINVATLLNHQQMLSREMAGLLLVFQDS